MGGNKRRAGARFLTEFERTLMEAIPVQVDLARVRLYQGECRGAAGWFRHLVLGASGNRAVALGNHVFLPDRCQGDLAVLAHELTHCGQYQAWGPAIYFARGMAAQFRELLHRRLGIGSSPYHYQVKPDKPFEAYGMEQQAQMVEDRFRRSGTNHAMPSA
jgi:hypothetical protein